MDLVLILPLVGVLIGVAGFFLSAWLFWLGVVICSVSIFLDIVSGSIKLPILPAIAVLAGVLFFSPWYVGIGVGLIIYAAVEVAGILARRIRD